MATSDAAPVASYELPLREPGGPADAPACLARLPESMLLSNVLWFCRLRWIVTAILGAFGVLGLFPAALARLGLRASTDWPLAAAAVLALGNIAFRAHVGLLRRTASLRHARLNLWGQIVFDLLVLTAVVHFVGSLGTSIPFAYLFHIVLACIFFSGAESLAVTLLACGLYLACLLVEHGGGLAPDGLYTTPFARQHTELTAGAARLNVGLALGIWLAVWYLASHLSALVRARDHALAETNRRLEAAIEERSRHMLRTTHELKAPFAAIHATTQVLLDGHCGELPVQAASFVRRIETRCRRLANEIHEMVQLANLRSKSQGALPMADVDAAKALAWCLGQIQPLAEERHVTLHPDLRPARTWAVEDHLKMAFSNLLGNAVTYSHRGGRVAVRCRPADDGGALVLIEDEGIGIPADKLPHIFEEYYRTDEGVRHNTQSSGLGLTIVRHVAQAHGIRIRVESRPGAGTRFRLDLPPSRLPGGPDPLTKETDHGLPDDR